MDMSGAAMSVPRAGAPAPRDASGHRGVKYKDLRAPGLAGLPRGRHAGRGPAGRAGGG